MLRDIIGFYIARLKKTQQGNYCHSHLIVFIHDRFFSSYIGNLCFLKFPLACILAVNHVQYKWTT